MNTKFVPLISRPCSQDWNAMSGDNQRRFCDQCQLHVHNFSAMSPAEQQALLAGSTGRRCIAYVVPDGAIQVRPGTWILLQRLLRPWRAGIALCTLWLPFVFSSCAASRPLSPPSPPETHDSKRVRETSDGKWVGGIMCEPPLWRRIVFFWERW